MASLFVIKGRDQGHRFELEEGSTAIGREIANAIQLHDTEVSRRHAEIRLNGTSCSVVDLNSSNGTFVNGNRIQLVDLASGDRIQMGASVMLFTGNSEAHDGDIADDVDIVPKFTSDDESQIVRSISHQEGSEVFQAEPDRGESPWIARARSNLQVMYRTALAVSHTLDIDQLLSRILELIFEWVEADRGCVMLVDLDTKNLHPRARRNRKGAKAEGRIVISQTILDYVRERNEGVMTSNAREDERWDTGASILQMGIHEAICVPMQGRYDVVGVIYIDTTTPAHRIVTTGKSNRFTDEHLKMMIAIAHQAALAVEDTSYYSAMVQAERLAAVGQTIATLSHHIKNILQGIRGGSYMIEMGLDDHEKLLTGDASELAAMAKAGETIRRGWNIVEKNQDKISNLVLDMLTFSKEREPDLVPSDMNEVAGDVLELMQTRAAENGVELVFKPFERLPSLTFDPEGLHRAILNVVTNAIDACDQESGGRVEMSVDYAPQESQLRVLVRDNGCGMESEDAEKMFVLFESRKGSRGTGLGLPVTQKNPQRAWRQCPRH